MKRLIFLAVILISALTTYSQGIDFSHGISFEDACKKAKQENKNIFVDVYTSWCGPCKILAKEVFPQKIVGDYFNKNFVSLSLDAEKDTANGFFKLYQAGAFPTLFWLNSEGRLLDSNTGVLSPENLIDRSKAAVENNLGERIAELDKRWNSGEHTLDLVKEYAFDVLRTTDPAKMRSVVEEYVAGLTDEEKKTNETKKVIVPFLSRGFENDAFPDDILFNTYVKFNDYYSSLEDPKNIDTGSFFRKQYLNFVRYPAGVYRKAKAGKTDMENFRKAQEKLESMNFSTKDMYVECLQYETLLIDQKEKEGIAAMKNILEKYGADHPHLYTDLIYSLAYNTGYFKKEKPEQIQTVLSITEQFLKIIPCKTSLFYYAAANKSNGDDLTAVSAFAWMSFYPGQVVSNAYYVNVFGLEDIRKQFPYR
jgi:thioredoxin-related protein